MMRPPLWLLPTPSFGHARVLETDAIVAERAEGLSGGARGADDQRVLDEGRATSVVTADGRERIDDGSCQLIVQQTLDVDGQLPADGLVTVAELHPPRSRGRCSSAR